MKLILLLGINLFGKAYRATKHEIWVSLKVLLLVTLCFAIPFEQPQEHSATRC
jgi:hypothetical protein